MNLHFVFLIVLIFISLIIFIVVTSIVISNPMNCDHMILETLNWEFKLRVIL